MMPQYWVGLQHTHLQLVVVPPEWPAIREVVFLMPRVGCITPSSAWVRGTELARVDTRRRSGVILAPAAAKAVAAGVTEAPPLEPAHQALGNHLVKTLPVLLGNEDPGKHCGTRVRLSEENRCAAASCSAQSVKKSFFNTIT